MQSFIKKEDKSLIDVENIETTVEPHLTVTSLNRSPVHCGHPGSVPNDFP